MKRSLMIAGVALLATWGVSTTVLADCGTCGVGAAKACPPGCTKPCCAKTDAVKTEGVKQPCRSDCAKPCCAKTDGVKTGVVEQACPPGCALPCCAKKSAAAGMACAKAAVGSCPVQNDVAVINTQALKALLDGGAKVTVLDARTGQYDDGRRIPGAKVLSPKATEAEVKKAIRGKDQLIVTYCANLQCPASGMLAERLKELGYKNVIEYPSGIAGWADAGNEVTNVK